MVRSRMGMAGEDCLGQDGVERKSNNAHNVVNHQDDEHKLRMDSESSSEYDGFEHLEPLDFDDIRRYVGLSGSEDTNSNRKHGKQGKQGKQGTRKRLDSLSSIDEDGDPKVTLFSVAMVLRRKAAGKPLPLNMRPQTRATKNWMKALHLTRGRADPWQKFHLDELPAEKAIRHKYNALTKSWSKEQVTVKLDKEPFAEGAMRECYRLKKLSNFSHNQDWSRDSNNYVAKSYMDPGVQNETYYEDVKLQMDAKLWGEEFNRHNPPKKVDIFMMAVLEFHERANKPLFHIEHYIDGDYIKYNSNSGFVENRMARQTPHAFSHFTFERSGHELIVVDVQGVGDLYTDPQIHTSEGTEYGDGNLGPRGMALFFHSHCCNSICKSLGLTQFDLAPGEKAHIKSSSSSIKSTSKTILRGNEMLCETPTEEDRSDHFNQFFRMRSMSIEGKYNLLARSATRSISNGSDTNGDEVFPSNSPIIDEDMVVKSESRGDHGLAQRRRLMTEMSDTNESDLLSFQEGLQNKARPSNLQAEMMRSNQHDDSILGQVHLALAKYHEICRFTDDGTYDKEAALFHLKAGAECGIVNAMVSVARLYCGLPHDVLSDINYDDDQLNPDEGLKFMESAAEAGDRAAMVYTARALDFGNNGAQRDYDRALYWYEMVVAHDDEEGGVDTGEWGLDDPPYLLMARMAELWMSGELKQGKSALKAGELYTKAAESAMTCMKGKLANKYYMKAEEVWGECEEEEE